MACGLLAGVLASASSVRADRIALLMRPDFSQAYAVHGGVPRFAGGESVPFAVYVVSEDIEGNGDDHQGVTGAAWELWTDTNIDQHLFDAAASGYVPDPPPQRPVRVTRPWWVASVPPPGAIFVGGFGFKTAFERGCRGGDPYGGTGVDIEYALVFHSCFSGQNVPFRPECKEFDLDGDGDIDLADWLIVQQGWIWNCDPFGCPCENPVGTLVNSGLLMQILWTADVSLETPGLQPESKAGVGIGERPAGGVWDVADSLVSVPTARGVYHVDLLAQEAIVIRADIDLNVDARNGYVERVIPENGYELVGDSFVFDVFGRGDYDGDGDVDLADFVVFQVCFGGSNNPPAPTCPGGVIADLDGDEDVDLADFLIFQQNFTGSG